MGFFTNWVKKIAGYKNGHDTENNLYKTNQDEYYKKYPLKEIVDEHGNKVGIMSKKDTIFIKKKYKREREFNKDTGEDVSYKVKTIDFKIFSKFFYHRSHKDTYLKLCYDKYCYYQDIYNISNTIEFLSQIAHESNNLRYKSESNKYSANRLLAVFPKYFKTVEEAEKYSNSDRIFDRVYANRMGNGSEKSKDGSTFKGRGFIQLTGRNNYIAFGFVDKPFELESISGAWESAFHFWMSNNLDTMNDFREMTKTINGGYNGLKDREAKRRKLIDIIADHKNESKEPLDRSYY